MIIDYSESPESQVSYMEPKINNVSIFLLQRHLNLKNHTKITASLTFHYLFILYVLSSQYIFEIVV